MKMRISVLGGCHVNGYPYESNQSFPSLLAMQSESQVVERIANVQFVKMPQHLQNIERIRPSHVIMQLGNYEFCASAVSLLKQACSVLGLKLTAKKGTENTARATSTAKFASSQSKLLTSAKLYMRVVALGIPMSVLWLCSPPHRRAFRMLNMCVRQHQSTRFVFLSPFPHLDPAVNTMRRLGGWLLRLGIASAPNFHWLDSHQFIERDSTLFYDLGHLNEEGHCYLATKLAEILPTL
jgi:hypothetical protein